MTAFSLPDRLSAKRSPDLIRDDERHFAAISASLAGSIADVENQLDAARLSAGGHGQTALDRDLEIHRLTARLRVLRRFGLDACLGRMITRAGESIYVGRFGLTDVDGRRLLVDWRSPAAEPFFGATHGQPHGLASRRRYRWTLGRITDYWDEVFTPEGLESNVALDDQSAFIASLGSSRTARMRDVLGTIQSDQDAIIRAGSRGAFVVDGGPGTGKTVVALHRTAYLLYSDPRLERRRGGVLFVGPHSSYVAYVSDVLPSLGEEGVQVCTLRDFVPAGADAVPETDREVARLKASGRVVELIDNAVRHYEHPPTAPVLVETPWGDVEVDAADWAEAFGAPERGAPHNEAREQVWNALLEIIVDSLGEAAPPGVMMKALERDGELRTTFARTWSLLDPENVVRDLMSVPAYLRQSAPWLTESEVALLQRSPDEAFTISDLPWVDAARHRIGDPEASKRARRRDAAIAAERERRSRVVDELIAADDSELMLMSMLRGEDAQNSLDDESALPTLTPDELAGPFAHIVVDEAQEFTDAEWQMLLARCPSRSFTIVGDRAQARHGFREKWEERLARVGITEVTMARLSVNYRTPEEVMEVAAPVIHSVIPDANVPTSVRRSGLPVVRARRERLGEILERWSTENDDGIACVIGDPTFEASARVRSLSPESSKGLEFDLVVLVDPDRFGDGIEGAVDRYVAMTRATGQLVILERLRDVTDRGEAAVPLGADRVEVASGRAEFCADDPKAHFAPDPHRFDESGVFEHGEVAGDRLARHGQARGEGRCRGIALAESREDAPARLVAERGEHGDEGRGGHAVPSRRATSSSSSEFQP